MDSSRGVGMPKRHRLGFAAGTVVEYDDGTAGYVQGESPLNSSESASPT